MTPEFRGTAQPDGRIKFDEPRAFRQHVAKYAGKPIRVRVTGITKTRSSQANRYYFGVVLPIIASDLGYTVDEAHEAIAWKFLQEGDPDAKLPKRKSTATLTSHEFQDYGSQVIQFAAVELGIVVPPASDYGY